MTYVVGGLEAVKRKQELQSEIECQFELGGEGLDEQDKYLLVWKTQNNPQGRITTTGRWQFKPHGRAERLREEQSRRENCSARERHVSNIS